MVTVMLPPLRGRDALREAFKVATRIKKKAGIKFNRDAEDPYQALLAVLQGLETLVEDYRRFRGIENLVKQVAEEKGERLQDGVYIWPRHLKEAAEDIGVDWDELKRILKDLEIVSYDRRVGKYRVKEL